MMARYPKLTEEQKDAICQARREGLSYRAISKRCGRNRHTIWEVLLERGLAADNHRIAEGSHIEKIGPYAKHGEYVQFLLSHETEGVKCW